VLTLTAAVCVAGLGTGGASAQAQRPVAHGLIVKLKEGASASALQSVGSDEMAGRRERLQRVIQSASAGGPTVRSARTFARIAQRLDFGRPLQADEAERLMAKLRAHPDVEWVEPHTRERRLAIPNDCYYPSPTRSLVSCGQVTSVGQWWMYPVGGESTDAIANRRRGVAGFETAWNRSTGVAAARVAVLDTGIVSHPELSGRVLPGYDFVRVSVYANDLDGRDADPTDPGDWVEQADKDADPARFAACAIENSSWHGTDIAGLIVATTNELAPRGTAAINWNGRVLPVRVAGKCGADPDDIVEGMYWAAGLPACQVARDSVGNCATPAPANPNPARIVSISFGGTGDCGVYQKAIDDLRAAGVVIVAAAGNEQGAVTRPAKCPGVVGVGAVNRDGFKTNYSNFGPELTITTVGGDPKSPGNGNWASTLGDDGILGIDVVGAKQVEGYGHAYLFGTSFSAPIVGGAISLMLSVNPALTHQQIVEGLRASARPHVTSTQMPQCSASNGSIGRCICTTTTCGAGLLDVEQALLYAQSPAAYVAPAWQGASIDSPDIVAAMQIPNDEPDADSAGGGGGALQPAWLAALALVTLLTAAASRAASRRRTRHR
jgi:serine protease